MVLCYVMLLWCRAVVDDVGDHAMLEHSVFRSPDELVLFGSNGSLYPSKLFGHFSHWRPLAFLPLSFQSLLNFQDRAFSRYAPRKAICRWRILFIGVRCIPAYFYASSLILHNSVEPIVMLLCGFYNSVAYFIFESYVCVIRVRYFSYGSTGCRF